MDYHGLPLFTITDTVTDTTRQEYYDRHSDIMTSQRQDLMRPFHAAQFRVSGTAHLMPEFMISNTAKESLIYPQGFLLLEADAYYFTDRSDLESYELRFTLEGEGLLDYSGKTYAISEGEGYLIDCRKHHYYRSSGEKWVSTVFHFNGIPAAPIVQAFLQSGTVKFSNTIFPNFEIMQMQILQDTQKVSPYAEYKLSCEFHMLLTELLITHSKSSISENTNNIIENMVRYLQEAYAEDLSVEALARKFNISKTHLSRCFRQYTGFSPHEYLIQLRLNAAKILLKSTDLSVEEICTRSGFQDTAYFIQAFKKREGVTPLKFRKSS